MIRTVTAATVVEVSEGLRMARFEGRRAERLKALIARPDLYEGLAASFRVDAFDGGACIAQEVRLLVTIQGGRLIVDTDGRVFSEAIAVDL